MFAVASLRPGLGGRGVLSVPRLPASVPDRRTSDPGLCLRSELPDCMHLSLVYKSLLLLFCVVWNSPTLKRVFSVRFSPLGSSPLGFSAILFLEV